MDLVTFSYDSSTLVVVLGVCLRSRRSFLVESGSSGDEGGFKGGGVVSDGGGVVLE